MKRSRSCTNSSVLSDEGQHSKRMRPNLATSGEVIQTVATTTRPTNTLAEEKLAYPKSKFRHRPLDASKKEIRLVRLFPAIADGLIRCELQHVEIQDDMPDYTALSYVWGESTELRDIEIDGQTFSVFQNLYDFLSMRHATIEAPMMLWIDQLSIDQDHMDEKNHQVRIMSTIYAKARSGAAVWLGPENEQTAMAMHFLTSSEYAPRNAGRWGPYSEHLAPPEALNDKVDLVRPAVISLLTLEYWSRLWIIQEIMLAHPVTVNWGRHTVPFASLARCLKHGEPYPWDHYRVSLYEAVNILHKCLCKDPRDKIYAIRSIVTEEPFIRVDFNASTEDVFYSAINLMAEFGEIWSDPPEHVEKIVWLCIQLAGQMIPKRLVGIRVETVKRLVDEMIKQVPTTTDEEANWRRLRDMLEAGWLMNSLKLFFALSAPYNEDGT